VWDDMNYAPNWPPCARQTAKWLCPIVIPAGYVKQIPY